MKKQPLTMILLLVGLLIGLFSVPAAQAGVLEQQPTVSVPTVTGTPIGPAIRVNADNDQINVRSGPGTDYELIGVLIAGEIVPANGRSAGGSWIQVDYPGVPGGVGWVYSPLVTLVGGGELPILEPPPTATPRVTPTIDPTLAAQFIVEAAPTRLPTFTPPAPLVVPTFQAPVDTGVDFGIPIGMVIVILAAIGIFGAIISLIRGR